MSTEQTPQTETGGLGGAVRTVGSVTLASRVLGLVRDLILVRVFGNTAIGSAFAAAFAVPNLFRRLFGEGALAAALVPIYTEQREADKVVADRYGSAVIALTAVATTLMLIAVELTLAGLLWALPRDAERDRSLTLVMIMLPFMPLVCVSAAMGAILHVHRVFFPTAVAPVIVNLFMIGGGIWHFATSADPLATARLVGVLTVVAGVVQIGWCARALRGRFRWTRVFEGTGPGLRKTARNFIPVALGLGVIQINSFFDTLLAMYPSWVGPEIFGRAYPLDEQANAVLFFTQRLYQFPLGVFGIAVATAVFPLLAAHAKQPERFARTLAQGVRLSFFIGLPASIGLALVRTDAVTVLFGQTGGTGEAETGGGFDALGLERSAAVLLAYAAAVWAYSLNHVFTRAMYAQGDTKTPVRVAIGAVLLNTSLNLVMIWPLAEAGLAWATAISSVAQCVVLGLLLERKGRKAGAGALEPADVRSLLITVTSSLVMGVLVFLTLRLWPGISSGASPGDESASGFWDVPWNGAALRLVVACAVGAVSYGCTALILRRPEYRWLLERSAGSKEGQ